jgi:hypothetical protein
MIPPFDIFRVESDNQPVWVEAAPTLEDAQSRAEKLALSLKTEVWIFSQRTGNKIAVKPVRRSQDDKAK